MYITGFFYRHTFLEILQNLKEKKSEKKRLIMITPKIYIILLVLSFLSLINYLGHASQLITIALTICISLYGIDRYWYSAFVDKVFSKDSATEVLAKGQAKKFIGDAYSIILLLQIVIIAFTALILSRNAMQSDLFVTLLAFTVCIIVLFEYFSI